MNARRTTRILTLAMAGSAAAILCRNQAGWHAAVQPAAPPGPVAAAIKVPASEGESLLAQLRAQAEAADSMPEDQRESAWAELVASFPRENLPQLLQTLSVASDEASVELRQLLVRRWAHADPATAADWAVRFAASSIQKESLQQVALVWAQSDLTQAVLWARTLPEDERADIALTLAYEAARSDPRTALTLAANLPAGQAVNELINHAVAQWATTDPAAAAEWAGQITDAVLRDQVLSGIATEWGGSSPAAAANLALTAIAPGTLQDNAVVGIVQRWVQSDPTGAGDWVIRFPAGQLQHIAMENLVKPWAVQNSDQVGQWLNTLKDGPARDAAVVAYASAIMPNAHALAADWASSISQDGLRGNELNAVISDWLTRDDTAARNWLAQNAQVPARAPTPFSLHDAPAAGP